MCVNALDVTEMCWEGWWRHGKDAGQKCWTWQSRHQENSSRQLIFSTLDVSCTSASPPVPDILVGMWTARWKPVGRRIKSNPACDRPVYECTVKIYTLLQSVAFCPLCHALPTRFITNMREWIISEIESVRKWFQSEYEPLCLDNEDSFQRERWQTILRPSQDLRSSIQRPERQQKQFQFSDIPQQFLPRWSWWSRTSLWQQQLL